jgi:hypothetical protein
MVEMSPSLAPEDAIGWTNPDVTVMRAASALLQASELVAIMITAIEFIRISAFLI